jgi:WD40 repeat protein
VAQGGIAAVPQLVINAAGHTAAVNKVCFVGHDRLVSVSNDKTIRFWPIPAGEPGDVLRVPIGAGLAGALHAVAVSPDGQWLAAAGFEYPGEDHGIYLIRLSDTSVAGVLRGHTNAIIDLRFTSDNRWLAAASADKTARVWDVQARRQVAVLRGHRDGVYSVAFSPRADRLATASLDHTARLWAIPDGRPLRSLPGAAAALQSIDWSPDGRLLVAGCVDQSILLWSADGVQVRQYRKLGNH